MAAGQGYIEFSTGDVLTAAAANGYLASQVVMVFADAAARTTAITSPQEGMISYLKDTNSTEYYSGSAWVAIGGGGSSTFAGCRVLLTAAQSISNSTDTSIAFTSETYDTDGYHSTTTNTSRMTIPAGKAGYYQLSSSVTYKPNGTGIRATDFFKNGVRAQYSEIKPQSSGDQSVSQTTILYGAEGDYFEVVVFQNSGGALDIYSPGAAATSFAIGYLGA
jgi:hypothetical protein